MTAVLQFPNAPRADAAESAKLLKQALAQRFPSTRFSVRLSRGTAYGNCHVSWTDGPTVKVVDAVAAPFEGAGFDGMTDSTIYYKAYLPDGRRSGLRMILTERKISPALARKCAAQVADYYGLPLPEITEDNAGYWQVKHDGGWVREDIREYWSTLIYQAAGDHSRYARVSA